MHRFCSLFIWISFSFTWKCWNITLKKNLFCYLNIKASKKFQQPPQQLWKATVQRQAQVASIKTSCTLFLPKLVQILLVLVKLKQSCSKDFHSLILFVHCVKQHQLQLSVFLKSFLANIFHFCTERSNEKTYA